MAPRINTNSTILAERLRIREIIESKEGLRNPKMAREFALRTSLDQESARRLLAQAPAENPFVEAMAREGINLNAVEASGGEGALGEDPRERRIREIKANVGGKKRKA